MARVDYDKQSAVFARGRELPPEAIATWTVVARRHIGDGPAAVLDLGSGTGRFSGALADAFDTIVIAVEPSEGMRTQAPPHARVVRLGGAAEHLPLRDDSCDAAWLSNVVHHFDNVDAVAAELRRVLSTESPVLIRGAFAGRPVATLYDFFPGTEKTIESFPSVNEVVDVFLGAGFASFSLEKVEQLLARSMTEMIERIKLRADTTLELLSDDEFAEGLKRMEQAAANDDSPVLDYLDLLVLR